MQPYHIIKIGPFLWRWVLFNEARTRGLATSEGRAILKAERAYRESLR